MCGGPFYDDSKTNTRKFCSNKCKELFKEKPKHEPIEATIAEIELHQRERNGKPYEFGK